MSRLVRLAVAFVVVAGSVALSSSARATGEDACAAVVGLAAESRDGSAAVLFVHGWTGRPESWRGAIDLRIDENVDLLERSLVEQVERIEGADAWLLDYHDTSGRWVDDPEGAGPRTAAAIDCLFERYEAPVSVVAHSMGGLGARWAAARDDRAERIASVVTLGTPHLGSDHAAIAAQVLGVDDDTDLLDGFTPLLALLLRACGLFTSVDVDSCAPLPAQIAAFDSSAAQALRTGSPELAELDEHSPWPDGLAVLAVAGEIEIVAQANLRLFYQDLATYHAGDGTVSSASATARATDTHVGTCRHNLSDFGYTLSDAGRLLDLRPDTGTERSVFTVTTSPCWHGRLMRTVELTNRTLNHLNQHMPARPTPRAPIAVFDWDGTRYDVGKVIDVRTMEGTIVIDFDRYQVRAGPDFSEYRTGPELTDEPVFYGNTDSPYLNQSEQLRTFAVSETANILVLGNAEAICDAWDHGTPVPPPTWDERNPTALPDLLVSSDPVELSFETDIASLAFNDMGQVTTLHLTRGC